ncbi:MAG: hypothetical protein ACU4EQ_02820 [Candidatus Nitrosoglobus sp.]|jgi:hypothetical protein
MRKIGYVVILGAYGLALLLVGGCTEQYIDKLFTPPPSYLELDADDAKLLLQYYHNLTSLSEDELQREFDKAWQAIAKSPVAFDRLRLVLLLSLPGTPFQNLDQARVMVHDFFKSENTKELSNLALLIQGFLMEDAHQARRYRVLKEELKRKEEQVRRLRSGLRNLDGRRKQEQEWAKSLEQQLEDERGKAETLEQKLEALKTIEQRLEYRNQPEETLELPEQREDLDE